MWPNFSSYTHHKKNKISGCCQWLVMLGTKPVLFRQSSSCGKVTDASSDLGCDMWSIHQPRPPCQTRAPASAGGVIDEGVTYCAMPQFIALEANGRALKFWFFVIALHHEKLGHMLKPLVPKFRLDLLAHLKDITEKQVPWAETNSRYFTMI